MTQAPYNKDVDKIISKIPRHHLAQGWSGDELYDVSVDQLRKWLVKAWLAGLGHSLELIEKKPKSFEHCQTGDK